MDNKIFKTLENDAGLSSSETTFHYSEHNNIIKATYQGGSVAEGMIIGKRLGQNNISLLYQCITTDGVLKSGTSIGTVSKNQEGRLVLEFDWQWLNGDQTGGKSQYIEIIHSNPEPS